MKERNPAHTALTINKDFDSCFIAVYYLITTPYLAILCRKDDPIYKPVGIVKQIVKSRFLTNEGVANH